MVWREPVKPGEGMHAAGGIARHDEPLFLSLDSLEAVLPGLGVSPEGRAGD
jgi:hypothetical protein